MICMLTIWSSPSGRVDTCPVGSECWSGQSLAAGRVYRPSGAISNELLSISYNCNLITVHKTSKEINQKKQ